MLDLTDIASGYGETQVLHGLSLRAEPGRVLAILGRNGAGKSTTLKTIMGLVPAKGGQVVFDGQPITGKTPFDIAKLGIAYVPETRDIFKSLTVRENLNLAARRFPCPPADGPWRGWWNCSPGWESGWRTAATSFPAVRRRCWPSRGAC